MADIFSFARISKQINEDLGKKESSSLLGIGGDNDQINNTYKIRKAVLNYYRLKFNDEKEVEYNNQIFQNYMKIIIYRATFKN